MNRRGFTLVEILITVALMALLIGVALPVFNTGARAQLLAAASLLASDVEYAQSLALSAPDDPALVRLDAANDRYWVALLSSPETPVDLPSGDGPYLVQFGAGDALHLAGVTIGDDAPEAVAFDGFGRLQTMTDASVALTSPAGERRVLVSATTGVVTLE